MRTPTKFVNALTQAQQQHLKEIQKSDPTHRVRMRAVLLSARGYSLDQIAAIYQQDRDRVSLWLDWWEEYQYDGLADDPKSGRQRRCLTKTLKKSIRHRSQDPALFGNCLSAN